MTRRLTALAATLAAVCAAPAAAHAATTVPPGNLTASATWTAAGSPYVLAGDVTVPTGITLTIQAGVTVKLGPGDTLGSGYDTARTELRVVGTLITQGTAASHVTLTGSGSPFSVGMYYGIVALTGGTVTLANTDITYGQRGIFVSGAATVNVTGGRIQSCQVDVYLSGGTTTLTGTTLNNAQFQGISANATSTLTASGLTVTMNGTDGIDAANADVTVSGSLITNNTGKGFYDYDSVAGHTSKLIGSTVYGNGSYGVYASVSNTVLYLTDDIIVNNGTVGIYRTTSNPTVYTSHDLVWGQTTNYYNLSPGSGCLSENPLFVDTATLKLGITSNSPARLHGSTGNDIGAIAYAGDPTKVLAGHLYANTTWTAAGGPYDVVGDITVEPGVTLTIAAGADVRFAARADLMGGGDDANLTELRVGGTLVANGTATSGIHLHSAAGTAAPGDWMGVHLLATSSASSLDYVTVEDGGFGIQSEAPLGSKVQHSVIAGNSNTGIKIDGGSLAVSQVTVRNNGPYGILVQNADATVDKSLLYDNSNQGFYAYQSAAGHTVKLTGSTVVANKSYGVYVTGSNTVLYLTDDIIANNGNAGIQRSTSNPAVYTSHDLVWGQPTNYYNLSPASTCIAENPLFVDLATRDLRITSRSPARLHGSTGADIGALAFDGTATVPLAGHLYANTTWTAAGGPYDVVGDITVEPGVTLTIAPGAEVRFAAHADLMGGGGDTALTELRVLGTLVADGTATSGIHLHSAASAPAPADWSGVRLFPGSTASFFDYVTLEDAANGIESEAPAGSRVQRSVIAGNSLRGVYVDGGSLAVSQVTAKNNGAYGIAVVHADATVDQSLLYDNGAWGLYVTQSATGHTVTLTGSTVVANKTYGVYATGSNTVLYLTDDIVADNGSYGVYRSTTNPAVYTSHDLVWGQSTNYYNLSPASTSIRENPLFVDLANRDLRITSRSPARLHGSTGADIGALPFDGAPTVPLEGHLYTNTTWTAAGGPYTLVGDLTVEPGITFTVEAGTTILATTSADDMGGGGDATRTEVRVLGHLVVTGTKAAPVTFSSTTAAAKSDWLGIELLSGATAAVAGANVAYAQYGYQIDTTGSVTLTGGEVSQIRSYGVMIRAGTAHLDGVVIDYADSAGVYAYNADPVLDNLVLYGNKVEGLYAYASSAHTVTVRNATIDANVNYGIYAGGSYLTLKASGCVITNNNAYGIYGDSGSPTVYLDHNDVWNQATEYHNVSAGSGDISANPLFVNGIIHNYHLQASSPCVDAGSPTSPLTTDADGAARPVAGISGGPALVDIGAFEYNPSANKWPIADAGPARTVVSGVAANFDGSGSYDPDGTIASYAWDFGDGTTGTGAKPSHTFTGGTDRTVTLTVTDNQGATGTATVAVKVDLPPVAAAGPDKYENPGIAVTFDGSGSTDADGTLAGFHWDFGDGAAASGKVVNHQYQAGGDYTATLTVTDNDGATATGTCIAHITGGVDTTAPTITLSPVADGQPAGQAVTVSAGVTDATGVASVNLYYRVTGGSTFTAVAMTGTAGTYTATIPGTAVSAPGMDYYLDATDTASPANTGTDPSTAPAAVHAFTVIAADTTAPTISVTPVADGQPEAQAVTVTATVTDATGVGTVTLYYRTQGAASFTSMAMSAATGSAYTAAIPAAQVAAPGVDFYVEATDTAATPNTGTDPATAPVTFHSFTVTAADTAPPTISVTPVADGQTAGQPVTVAATVTDATGVGTVTLYYRTQGGGSFASVAMSATTGSAYTADVPAAAVAVPGVDYYVEATDTAATPNTGTDPATAPTAFHSFTVGQPSTILAGDLVVDEIMNNPTGTESVREWFEIHNTTGAPIDVDGLTFADTGTDTFTVNNGGPLPIAAGGYLVFGRSSDTTLNGGVTVDYVYNGMQLSNASDEIIIKSGTTVIDEVAWDNGATFPDIEGSSMSLDPSALDATANDSGANWCLATTPLADGDHGTPGAANDGCGLVADTTPPSITHTKVADGQPAGLAVTVTAVVTDASTVASVTLFYRTTGAGGFVSAAMTQGSGDTWQGAIPASAVTTAGVDYYLLAEDASAAANQASDPAGGAASPYQFTVGTGDTAGPQITHQPVKGPVPAAQAIDVTATVTDGSGVASVTLFVQSGTGGAFTPIAMASTGGDQYAATIPAAAVVAPQLGYYLEAVDGSPAANVSDLPAAADASPFVVDVQAPDGTGPTIDHTPIADGQPADMALTVTATVTDPSGVAEVRVYFRQKGTGAFLSTPLTAGTDGKTYTATLPGSVIQPPAVEYYLEAVDGSDAQNTSHDPATAPADTHAFTVKAATTGGGGKKTPGGCGCTATGSGSDGLLGLVLLALGAAVLKRRRYSGGGTRSASSPGTTG